MDSITRKILFHLQGNGRISNTALAEKVGLSASACLRRVQSLEQSGKIVGYTAVFNEKLLGLGTYTLTMVTLNSQEHEHLQKFENAAKKIPNILTCYLMGGAYDYLMHIIVKDIEDYENLHRTKLTQLPHVARLQSNFAMREIIKRPNPIL